MITNKEKGFLEQVPEPKVTAKPSGFEASSKEAKFLGPAHNPAYVHDNSNEKKEEQARCLGKATLQLKGIVNIMCNSLFESLHLGVTND